MDGEWPSDSHSFAIVYDHTVDALTGLLGTPHARGAFVLRIVLSSPWGLRIEDRSPLTVIAPLRGPLWFVPDHGPPTALSPGTVSVIVGGRPYTIADQPATTPTVVVDPCQACRTLSGEPLAERMNLGVRTWGNDPGGDTEFVIGCYEEPAAVGERLLAALPRLITVAPWDGPLLDLLTAEAAVDEPGQGAVLDRLLDLVLINALRRWLRTDDGRASSWYQAHTDPIVGAVLRAIDDEPATAWTVASLASSVGVSRALLARRFTELVGVPPMTYLTEHRLAVAADLLAHGDRTIESVAGEVGYGSAFALSTAFKRVRGVSPRDHRRATAAPTGGARHQRSPKPTHAGSAR